MVARLNLQEGSRQPRVVLHVLGTPLDVQDGPRAAAVAARVTILLPSGGLYQDPYQSGMMRDRYLNSVDRRAGPAT